VGGPGEHVKVTPDLSVIVASYNGASFLPRCLASLRDQVGGPEMEIIVVDDGSTDDTWAQILRFDVVGIRLPENRGLSAARNAGLARATGAIVAFVDDDEQAPERWAAGLTAFWKDAPSSAAILCGFTDALAVDTFNRRFAAWHRPFMPSEQIRAGSGLIAGRLRRYFGQVSRASVGAARPVDRAVGCAMSMRRADLLALGGFAEEIRFGGEDDELSVRAAESFGVNAIWFDPSIELRHDFGPSFRSTLRRFRLYGRGDARRVLDHGGVPAVQPMPVFVIAAAIVAGLLRPRWGLIAGAAVPYVLTAPRLGPAIRRDGPTALAYPLALLGIETAADVGLVHGLVSGRGPRAGDRAGKA
jgi:glycosyltransferase involved in cell wall biosynthesis